MEIRPSAFKRALTLPGTAGHYQLLAAVLNSATLSRALGPYKPP
jgi:hypothetical protein